MHFWSIKGVYFLQNANNLNFKLFFRLYVYVVHYIVNKVLIVLNWLLSLEFWRQKKSCTSCPWHMNDNLVFCVTISNKHILPKENFFRKVCFWARKRTKTSRPTLLAQATFLGQFLIVIRIKGAESIEGLLIESIARISNASGKKGLPDLSQPRWGRPRSGAASTGQKPSRRKYFE